MSQQISSDSISPTARNYRVNMFFLIFRNLFIRVFVRVRFYSYEDILLRLFYDISSTGDFHRLIISGDATLQNCLEHWERIVKRNAEENDSFQYLSYFSLYQGYQLLHAQHTTIKLLLVRASIKFDESVNQELTQRGYPIDTSSNQAYAKSLEVATRKSNALVTKINMKRSEIENHLSDGKGGKPKKQDTFEDLIASLELALGDGRNIPDDITLAKFNSLKKVAKRKNDALKRATKKR